MIICSVASRNTGQGTDRTALRHELMASGQTGGKVLAQPSVKVGETAVPSLQGRSLIHELGAALDDTERECPQLRMGLCKRRSQPSASCSA